VLHGETFDDAREHALALAEAQGLSFIHPFDDALVIAGQGTIGIEMLRAQPQLDTLVIAVGGGGLISGIATAVRALKPGVQIVGVQTSRFPAMVNAVKGTSHAQGSSTIAEGIAVGQPGRLTQQIIRERVDDLLLVDEGDIEQAMLMLLEIEKTVVEGAGAAGLAALLRHPDQFAGRHVGLVLCGGNIDPLLLQAIIGRGMVRAGRLARIRVAARDTPGVLARITAVVGEGGANIEEVHHQRAFSMLSAQNVEVELVLQTRNPAHVREVVAALQAAGFEAASY
jgi:threonine dehydratase